MIQTGKRAIKVVLLLAGAVLLAFIVGRIALLIPERSVPFQAEVWKHANPASFIGSRERLSMLESLLSRMRGCKHLSDATQLLGTPDQDSPCQEANLDQRTGCSDGSDHVATFFVGTDYSSLESWPIVLVVVYSKEGLIKHFTATAG